MEIIRSAEYTAGKSWEAKDITEMDGTSVRLHWANEPYRWHINDGEEVFAVLSGSVEMFYRLAGEKKSSILNTGDIFYASTGTEHMAHPLGEARILVIEKAGSV